MDQVKQRKLSETNSLTLLQKIDQEPNYCECARIGSRALKDGSMPILRYLTQIPNYFDRKNLQLEHQHIIFSESKDNIGLMGHEGVPELFSEEPSSHDYHYGKGECFDGSLMRKAIEATGIPRAYAWLGYNCQAYVDQIKNKYQELKEGWVGKICSF